MHSLWSFGFRTKKGGSKKLEIDKNVKLFFPSSVLSESGSKGVISAVKAPPKVGSKLERIIGVCKFLGKEVDDLWLMVVREEMLYS